MIQTEGVECQWPGNQLDRCVRASMFELCAFGQLSLSLTDHFISRLCTTEFQLYLSAEMVLVAVVLKTLQYLHLP